MNVIKTMPCTFALTYEHRKQLDNLKKQGISSSFVVRKALDLYFANLEKEKK